MTPRAFEHVRRFGRDTVSFQTLESGYRYWFDGDDAMVAFVDTGGAWVAAGGPMAPPEQLARTALHFIDAARAQDRRACFFAAEAPLVDAGLSALHIGEQPVWTAAEWPAIVAAAPSLRYQLRRARNKHVTVRRIDPLHLDAPTRAAIDDLGRAWQAAHAMAPMQFLVQLEPLALAAERVIFVAEHAGAFVGYASAIPVYARRRLFVETFVRSPAAPNGTPELLVDAMMAASPYPEITLGLAPLAGDVSPWLRFAKFLGTPLYDFEGLRSFKAKLRPSSWEPIYLCVAPGQSKMIAMRDSLRAFAGGSLLAFAAKSLMKKD